MLIISQTKNEFGAYPPIQFCEDIPPIGWIEITADTTNFYTWNGFIIPKIVDSVVVDYKCNTKAWETWKASLPPIEPPKPTIEERTKALEAAVLEMTLGG